MSNLEQHATESVADVDAAQVEAAARALYEGASQGLPRAWEWTEQTPDSKRYWLNQARAALTAAAQVQPAPRTVNAAEVDAFCDRTGWFQTHVRTILAALDIEVTR